MNVLIGTPTLDGKVHTQYTESLIKTIKDSHEKAIKIEVEFVLYDNLIQRARNIIFKKAIEKNVDALFFIDSDTEWHSEWFYSLLSRNEPLVGAALVKKSENEAYTVKLIERDLLWSHDKKLISVDGFGTGFMCIKKFALDILWDKSEVFFLEGVEHRMICDVVVVNNDLVSEDYSFLNKWKSLGYKVWIDPTITISHVGYKKFKGDFLKNYKSNDTR